MNDIYEQHNTSRSSLNTDSAMLVIGLGGTGTEAVSTIKNAFTQCGDSIDATNRNNVSFTQNIAYLAIDCENNRGDLSTQEFISIGKTGLINTLDAENGRSRPWENEWLDKELYSISHMNHGAMPIRQLGRLALCRSYPEIYTEICNKLRIVIRRAAAKFANIIIVSSVCGGTGSGIFLDIAQIVRYIIEKEFVFERINYRISAYLIMPEVLFSILGSPSDPRRDTFRSNAYAALKELDFWMGYGKKHKTDYRMQYCADSDSCITWCRPFDSCALMDGRGNKDSKSVVFETIAEYLLYYMADNAMGRSLRAYEESRMLLLDKQIYPLPLNYCYRTIGVNTEKVSKEIIHRYSARKSVTHICERAGKQDEFSTALSELQNGVVDRTIPLLTLDSYGYSHIITPDCSERVFLEIPDCFNNHVLNEDRATFCTESDHITCIKILDGIPLYLYEGIERLKESYGGGRRAWYNPMGFHLVMRGEQDGDIAKNWASLPSAHPFYYFTYDDDSADREMFKRTQQLVENALKCNILSIDDSQPVPIYSVRIKYTAGSMVVPKTSELIMKEIAEIDQTVSALCDKQPTETLRLQLLLDYQKDTTLKTIIPTSTPFCMQKNLGLICYYCDPFTKEAAANPNTKDLLKERFRCLCEAFIAALICDDPATRMAMENQIKAMEYLQERINSILKANNA